MTTTQATYQMHGSVRGACPHQHRTLTGLARCAQQDARGCASQGGYSDRQPYAVIEGRRAPLTPEERNAYDAASDDRDA